MFVNINLKIFTVILQMEICVIVGQKYSAEKYFDKLLTNTYERDII